MTECVDEPLVVGGRVMFGAAVFAFSIFLPLIGLPVVASLGLSAGASATASGVLLVAAEVLGLAAVAIMGKPGYELIKGRISGFLKKHGPPERVGRARYRVGLVMFALPLLIGWLYPYVVQLLDGLPRTPLAVAVTGDVMLLASLFVLGGEFWEKLRSLFVHEATVCHPGTSYPAA